MATTRNGLCGQLVINHVAMVHEPDLAPVTIPHPQMVGKLALIKD